MRTTSRISRPSWGPRPKNKTLTGSGDAWAELEGDVGRAGWWVTLCSGQDRCSIAPRICSGLYPGFKLFAVISPLGCHQLSGVRGEMFPSNIPDACKSFLPNLWPQRQRSFLCRQRYWKHFEKLFLTGRRVTLSCRSQNGFLLSFRILNTVLCNKHCLASLQCKTMKQKT